jgi:hypothetical protein
MADPEKKDDKKEEKLELKKDSFSKEEVENLIKERELAVKTKVETEKDEAAKKIIETEKAKLYDTIEAEKKKSSELEKIVREKQKEEDEKKKVEEDKIREELDAKEQVKLLAKKLDDDSKRFQDIVELKDAEYKGELRKRDLEIYKEKLIASYNGAIIPEMVSGKTEEELNQAVEVAAERYKQIAERSKQEILDEAVKNGKLPKPGDLDNSLKKTSGAKDWKEVMEMPKEDYEAYKKSVFDALNK